MKQNKYKLALLISLTIFFGGFTAIYLYNNTNLLKDSVVENLESFSEELKISTWGWTTTEVVSTALSGDSRDPTIAVDGSGNVHIAWMDITNYGGSGMDVDIFYKRWNAITAAWTTTEVVSTESTGDSAGPTIAVDGSGNVHIAWYEFTDYGGSGWDLDVFYKRWNATTATWTTTEVVSTDSDDESHSPTIAVDGSGNAHIVWYDYTDYLTSGGDADIFYRRWNATTAAWTTTEVVSTALSGDSRDPTIAVDGSGNVHIAWDDETDYLTSGTDCDIFYRRWNATTAAWTTTAVVSTESPGDSLRPTIAVDGFGNAHIAWEDLTDYTGSGTDVDIYYKRWNVITVAWTTTEVVSTESTGDSLRPTIAVDDSGNVHIAWDEDTNYGGSGTDWDIFYKKLISTPLNPSIIINNGDASTNSTLVTLTLLADLAVEMCFRNGTTVAWTAWEPYATTKQLYLEGSINNTAYSICVKFRNAAGETSPVYDSILYSIFTPPLNPSIIINNGDASIDSTLVTLTLLADLAVEMCFRNGTTVAWTDWEPYATAKQLHLEGSIDKTEYSICVKFRNAVGETSPVCDSILYLAIPLNPSIIINNGNVTTNSTLVTLTLSADGTGEMCFRNETTGAWTDWEAYTTTKQLLLYGSSNNTVYTIYVKFRNVIGETSPVSDSILYLIIEEVEEEEEEEEFPIIPGYPDGWIIISLLAGIGVIAILNKSKRIKLRN